MLILYTNGNHILKPVFRSIKHYYWFKEPDSVPGSLVKSIYTFNGISKLKLIHSLQASISGTDGGKLEMYSLTSGHVISSVKAHQDSISALSVLEGKEKTLLGSGSTDGIIKIFTVNGQWSWSGLSLIHSR